jgi:glycosyltransferase involved in cell wall biosynthesis
VPLSPPITGASIASETVVNHLRQHHDVIVIPYQRGNLISGKFSLRQFMRVLIIGIRLALMRKNFDSVYFVISSTLWGNLRDLFFLVALGDKMRRKTVVHLHGANIDRYLRKAIYLIKYLNRRMLGSVRYGIVLGETFKNIFDGYISQNRIRIAKNYFTPSLLIDEASLLRKFNFPEKVNILFLSNLIKEKGYELLLDAFLSLREEVSGRAILHFAGEIYSDKEKTSFLDKIKNKDNIFYHGPVAGNEKRELLWGTHIFCLPTFYKYEGQPISILEAYGSGCIVLTTNNGGIKDIFQDGINGFFIDIDIDIDIAKNILREKLGMLIVNLENYKHMAIYNRKEALDKYTEKRFCMEMEQILLN